MDNSQSPEPRRPIYVKFALWGLKSRASAIVCVWLSMAVAIGSACFKFWPGLFFIAAAWWYWKAVKWVDRHGSWPNPVN